MTEVLFGLLKSRDVRVTALVRALGERISAKKSWERLIEVHLKGHAGQTRRMRYCVLDISDVQKPYGTQAEGLGLVRDGSAGVQDRVGPGYWWITAVMSDGKALLPVHSELFSV